MENEQELLEELSNCDIGELTEMMLLLEDEVSGNLKDCLTAYDLEQLEVIASNLLDGSEFMNLSKGKLIEKIVKEIYKLLENNLASLPQEILEDIEKLIKNPNYKIENKYLLAIGLVFGYYDEDDNVIYYIPEDVKQLFEQNISKEVKEDSLTSQIELYIQLGHICYGIVPKQELLYLADSNNKKQIEELIDKIRKEIPNVVLRTSLIVGFPGETTEDFEELKQFVEKAKFDKLGTFMYSKEEGTPAAKLPEQIHTNTKKSRYYQIMKIQQKISNENLQKKIGQQYEAIVEEISFDGNYLIGRTKQDVPDIDGIIYIKNKNAENTINKIIKVKIIDVEDYDLIGETI